MKCPKCKKEMGNCEKQGHKHPWCFLVCENEKCEFYGIERRDMRTLGVEREG